MADFIADYAKGRWAEKAADDATKFGVLLLKVAESDSTLRQRQTVAAILANGSTEANFTNYARKTPLTATLSVDTTNHREDLTLSDQTWTSAGGATNNTLAKLIVFYEESASDSGRVFVSAHDFVVTTNGADLTADFIGPQFARAA